MTKRISFSAMALALTVICLYAAATLSTGKLVALGLSSLFVCICISQFGVRYGIVLYIGASILSLLLIPNKMFVLLYVLFTGYYPVVKLYIEKLKKIQAEWILKFLFFNLILVLIYIVFKLFFTPALDSAITGLVLRYLWLVIIGLELIFIIYDWMLSYLVGYYHQFLRRMTHE